MATPPIPPAPHGFYSEIRRDQVLPQDLQSHLAKMVHHLHRMEKEPNTPSIDAHQLTKELEDYDRLHTDFLKKLNQNANRGFEKGVKDAFENMHNRFTDELNDIVDAKGRSLRDVLLSYDVKKLLTFIQDLNQSSQGKLSLRKLKNLTKSFSDEIVAIFKINLRA